MPSPTLPVYGHVYLNGVSCPSTTNCFAVGLEISFPTFYATALVEHWNGHTWSVMTSPTPTGSPGDAYLNEVSCPSTTSCFAVGYVYVKSGSTHLAIKTLVEQWNGHRWSIVTSPNPIGSGTPNSYLDGVSCRSTTSCFAVGYVQSGSSHPTSKTLVEHWNRHTWSIMTSSNPPGFRYHVLDGVSCPSTTSCSAVGFSQGSTVQALVEHWNGHTWSAMTRPTPTGTNNWDLSHLSCPTTTSCFAVGSYWVGGAAYAAGAVEKSLVEQWNGHTWSIMTSPNPTNATSTGLGGVSCPTSTHCFAVGFFSHDVSLGPMGVRTAEKTLVEQWDGHTWSIMTSPDPTQRGGFATMALNGVSCHRTTSCFAVGDFGSQNSDARTTLIERYR